MRTTLRYATRARLLDPSTGRCVSRNAPGLSVPPTQTYPYVQNNPVRFVDPSGLDQPARPSPEPPNWFRQRGVTVSIVDCFVPGQVPPGFSRPVEPIDDLDRACRSHDKCLATAWLFFTQQCECAWWLCGAARQAQKDGCAKKYIENRRLDWRGEPVLDWRGYHDCMRAASDMEAYFCTVAGQWFSG